MAYTWNDTLVVWTSQVILASLDQGVREGRMLLHDWLVILTAQYNDACKNVQSIAAHIDAEFSQCPQLQPLPRLIFALLRNPLLRFHEEGVHPDYRIYLQCLFRYVLCVQLFLLPLGIIWNTRGTTIIEHKFFVLIIRLVLGTPNFFPNFFPNDVA